MSEEEHRRTVEWGYDRVAEHYLATKDPEDPLALAALEDLARDLSPGAAVLDLGCGAGVPVTRWLVERGFAVTGVDLSERQLELARRSTPIPSRSPSRPARLGSTSTGRRDARSG